MQRPSIAVSRLRKELVRLGEEPLENVETRLVDGNLFHWRVVVIGPEGTPFAGGKYEIEMVFGESYPFSPPSLRFLTPIFHPNIGTDGTVCLDILRSNWSAIMTVSSVLISVVSFLSDPNPDHPFHPAAAHLYKFDRAKYNQVVEDMKRKQQQQEDRTEPTEPRD